MSTSWVSGRVPGAQARWNAAKDAPSRAQGGVLGMCVGCVLLCIYQSLSSVHTRAAAPPWSRSRDATVGSRQGHRPGSRPPGASPSQTRARSRRRCLPPRRGPPVAEHSPCKCPRSAAAPPAASSPAAAPACFEKRDSVGQAAQTSARPSSPPGPPHQRQPAELVQRRPRRGLALQHRSKHLREACARRRACAEWAPSGGPRRTGAPRGAQVRTAPAAAGRWWPQS